MTRIGIAILAIELLAACSSSHNEAKPSLTSAPAVTTITTTTRTTRGTLSAADTSQAIAAVHDNWDACIAAARASSQNASVATIADTATGRPVDRGNRPVLVRVTWGSKTATFLVDLRGHLTGAALFDTTARALVAAARAAGGRC